MFKDALKKVQPYTLPVVISHKTVGGRCNSGIGTFIVVNSDGWIITAAHILREFEKLVAACDQVRAYPTMRDQIENDKSLNRAERRKRLSTLKPPPQDTPDECSIWWAGGRITDVFIIDGVDLAVGRLEQFDTSIVRAFPTFKDATKDVDAGTSLCKLGFPFHEITPTFTKQGGFQLPPGSLPIPFFPIDGILTRLIELGTTVVNGNNVSAQWIETSTPGLRGQSGGPIFDSQGSVWGMQINTESIYLGFAPIVGKTREHQFINIGRGVYSVTIHGVLAQLGVQHSVSSY